MPKVEPIIKIENIVASATVKHGIELNSVVKAFPDSNFNLSIKTTTSLSVSPCAFFFSLLFLSWSSAFS